MFTCLGALATDTRTETLATIQVINQASLLSLKGEQVVDLPHILSQADFPPGGGRVRYQLVVHLAGKPSELLGVFVPKLSLSGQLFLNGALIDACGHGALEELRCLHQPQLFVPPPSLWQAGTNSLEFEIYANERQMNGLSPVEVGNAWELYDRPYFTQYLWQVDLLSGLTWLDLSLGLMALAVAMILRRDRLYLWFGLCSIVNALTNLNILIQHPQVNIELFSWFVFTMRLISTPLFLLMLLAIFERPAGWLQRFLLALLVLMPLATWISGNNRWVVLALYLPIVLTLVVLALFMVRWTWRSRQPLHIITTLITHLTLVAVGLDMMRLAGQSSFVGVYWLTYTFTAFVMVMGITLMSRLAISLMTERQSLLRLGLATKAADAGFWDWDLATNEITLTKELGRLLGMSPGKVADLKNSWTAWRARIHPNDLPEVERQVLAAPRERRPLRLEYRVIHEDGTPHWLETRADIRLDDRGRPRQLVGISLDVTRRKEIEIELDHYRANLENLVAERTAELERSESLFRSFFNLPIVGTAIIAPDRRWVEVNERTCQILGFPREEIFRKTWAELLHPEEQEANNDVFAQLLRGEIDSFSSEQRLLRKDERIVPVLVTGGVAQLTDQPGAVIHLQLLDLTERKQDEAALLQAHEALVVAQAEQAKQEERRRLLQDMHDGFGSQLATARLLMSQDHLSPAQGAALLGECLADLHLLVDTLGNTDQSLARALADYRYRCERRLSQETARVHWHLSLADCPLLPERTLLQLLRILQEGLNNALKHAQASRILIDVGYRPDGQIELSVTDDGVGLPAAIPYGRGLGHMESRAREIGAQLAFERLTPGTRLVLTLPVNPQ